MAETNGRTAAADKRFRPSMTEQELELVLACMWDRLKAYDRFAKRGNLRPGTKSHDTFERLHALHNAWSNMQVGQGRGAHGQRRRNMVNG